MTDTGYLKCACQSCGGHLEFPPSGSGMTIDCPHCGGKTTLSSPSPAAAPAEVSPTKTARKLPLIVGSIFVVLILAAALIAFYKIGRPNSTVTPMTNSATQAITNSGNSTESSPPPEEAQSLNASQVRLESTAGSGLVYATGTVQNNSDRQRFGVKIELDLLDEQDNKIGTAGDYLAVLEPHKGWQFRALLTQSRAVKVRVAKIEEQK